MLDIHSRLANLKRPKLLARAARFGAEEYRRNVHLPKLLQKSPLPRSAAAIMQLFDLESEINMLRLTKSGDYSPAKHVEVLIALIGEARLMAATQPR